MHYVHISLSVALCIFAKNSAAGNPGIDNLEVPALDPFTQPTTLDPNSLVALNNVASDNGAPDDNSPNTFALDDNTPNTFTLDDFAPNQKNVGSVGTLNLPNSDISGLTEGLTAISDSENCAGSLGKREDSGLTLACRPGIETPTSEIILPLNIPQNLQDLPKLPSKIRVDVSDWWYKQRKSLPILGNPLPKKPECDDILLCCRFEIPTPIGLVDTEYCGICE
ncbi:hypothetical protein MMC29_002827 [Sticta canariensis]|nr:hypothetical protein [Sticta canariensis]